MPFRSFHHLNKLAVTHCDICPALGLPLAEMMRWSTKAKVDLQRCCWAYIKQAEQTSKHPCQEYKPKKLVPTRGGIPPGHVSRNYSWQRKKWSRGSVELAERTTTKFQSQQFLIGIDHSGIPSSSLFIPQTSNYLFTSSLAARRKAYQKHKPPRQSRAGGDIVGRG